MAYQTPHEDKALGTYLREIARVSLLTPEEEKSLALDAQRGDERRQRDFLRAVEDCLGERFAGELRPCEHRRVCGRDPAPRGMRQPTGFRRRAPDQRRFGGALVLRDVERAERAAAGVPRPPAPRRPNRPKCFSSPPTP